MTSLQQKSLISFVVTHKKDCDCHQCQYFGGTGELFNIYEPECFTDNTLRRIWVWLFNKYQRTGCQIRDLDFQNDPTSPLFSDIADCSVESMVFEEKDGKLNYLLLKDILCRD